MTSSKDLDPFGIRGVYESIKWRYLPSWPLSNWPPPWLTFQQDIIYSIPHLDLAGLVEEKSTLHTKRLLFRQQALNLVNSLTRLKNLLGDDGKVACRGVIVEGPPGIGKSCATWSWVLNELAASLDEVEESTDKSQPKKTRSVLWVHIEEEYAYCTSMTRTEIKRVVFDLDYTEQLDKLKAVLYYATEDIVVVDGLIGNDEKHRQLTRKLVRNETAFHIQVASLAFNRAKSQILKAMTDFKVKVIKMYPWSLDEYKRACQNREFYDTVAPFLCDNDPEATSDQLIERKFFYAGVCARWMFATSTSHVIEYINEMIENVYDVTVHKDHLYYGDKLSIKTNGLVVKYADSHLFYASEYIALTLAVNCSSEILEILYNKASNLRNRKLVDWIFKMNVIWSCHEKGSLDLFRSDGHEPFSIKFDSVVTCSEEGGQLVFNPDIQSANLLNRVIIKPHAVINPSFELSRLEKHGDEWHMIFYQITINPRQEYDVNHYINHVQKIRELFSIKIARISIWRVVPINKETCNYSDVTFRSDMALFKVEEEEGNKSPVNQILIVGFKPLDRFYRSFLVSK